jgi:hypothetical protein
MGGAGASIELAIRWLLLEETIFESRNGPGRKKDVRLAGVDHESKAKK